MYSDWINKDSEPNGPESEMKYVEMPETRYKPKLVLKTPSMRAMKNYYDLNIDEGNHMQNDNLSFVADSENGEIRYDRPYSVGSGYLNDSLQFSEVKVGTLSTGTTISGSEFNSDKNEMGSTMKLVTPKIDITTKTWFSHTFTILCTLSLAASFGNIYRLPQTTLIRGGLPFLVSYITLVVLIGLPLLFLELGLGQLAQEGFIKSWRAVPFFKGIGYVKLLAGCLLSIYYPLYMGLSLYYIIWYLRGEAPFQDCATGVIITSNGYSANGINGQECLRKTFLKSPYNDPSWFGVYAGLLLVIWLVIAALSIRKTNSYIKSLIILLFPMIGCYIALVSRSVAEESETPTLDNFLNDANWDDLTSANTWYFAAIQVFFSTNVGFGSFTTNAGIMYNKVNPLWTALGYITVNLIFGIGSVLMNHILTGNLNVTASEGDVAELRLMSLIYDISKANDNHNEARIWAIVIHALILIAGLINMATITYTLLKAITVQNGNKLKWWQTNIVMCFLGFLFGCALLLGTDFDLVHLLDHYIVGNLIIISVIIEVYVFIAFYGMQRIKSDFEFMLGHILSKVWIFLWWLVPILLTIIFTWGLSTLPLEGINKVDPVWLYGLGWTVPLAAFLFIFLTGFFTVFKYDGYTFVDKFKASLEPSSKWGPKDPIQRHNWIQWNSKAQNGERDFTLKRRGTKDYTRSVKRSMKKSHANTSDLSATTISCSYSPNDQNHNNIRTSGSNSYDEPYEMKRNEPMSTIIRVNGHSNPSISTLRITSLVDSINPSTHTYTTTSTTRSSYPGNINPLARPVHYEELHDSSNSEGYGTFRKGPYIIENDEMVGHVCHRKHNEHEISTEL